MRRIAGAILAAAVLCAVAAWVLTMPSTLVASALPAHEPDPANGERVYIAGGCSACHKAPEAEDEAEDVLAGGQALATPFGTFLVPNISPDPEHGIGAWTPAQFVTAMLRGTSPEGEHYYPAFPYASYSRMTEADALDLLAHIRTLPASAEPNRPHDLGFPYNIRRAVGFWKMRYLSGAWVLADPPDAEVERGRYLVEALGHCGECHTPRDMLGGPDLDRWLAGGPNPDGEGRIPNITPAALDWSAGDIAYYLDTGFTPDFDSVGGSMVAVVEHTSKLTDGDRAAIAAYLKAVPPVPPQGG